MPFRAWMLAVAIGLIAGLGQAQESVGQPEIKPEASETDTADKPTEIPTPIAPSVATPTNPTSTEHDPGTAADGSKEPYKYPDIIRGDGWAQWAMVLLALLGVGISGWAVWLLKKTLDATVVAVREGEKATAASVKAAIAASEANEIMRGEQRPWVTLERDLLCDFVDIGGFQGRLVWNYDFNNKGKSPVYAITGHSKIIKGDGYFATIDEIETFTDECASKSSGGSVPIIFPNETTNKVRYRSLVWHVYDMSRNAEGIIEKKVVEGGAFWFLVLHHLSAGFGARLRNWR